MRFNAFYNEFLLKNPFRSIISMVIALLAFMATVIFLGVFGEFVFARTKIPDALWLIAI